MSYVHDEVAPAAGAEAAERHSDHTRWRMSWLRASQAGLAALVGGFVPFALGSGITWDEELHRTYGRAIYAWYGSGFSDRAALKHRSHLYGGLFDLAGEVLVSLHILPFGPFETRHVLTALVALLGVIACWKTAAKLAGARAGFLAAALLMLTPCWVGHGMFNPKDIPFGAAVAFVAYASVCIATRTGGPRWSDAARAGLAVGAALSVRSGGMFLIAFPWLAAGMRPVLDAWPLRRDERSTLFSQLGKAAGGCALAGVIAWGLMLSAWPWGQVEPLSRPLRAAKIAASFPHSYPVLFDGQQVLSDHLPRKYLFTWFAITLPELYLIAAVLSLVAVGLRLRARRRAPEDGFALLLLAALVGLPLLGVLIKQPVLYDGQRHFLFILPPLAALLGVGVDACLSELAERRWQLAAWLALSLPAAVTLLDMVHLHPYEYLFFNRSFGGLPAANQRYETDYWGATYREGFSWVMAHVPALPDRRIKLATCKQDFQLAYFLEQTPEAAERFELVPKGKGADIMVAFTRGPCVHSAGKPLHHVSRQNTVLLTVLDQRKPASKTKTKRAKPAPATP